MDKIWENQNFLSDNRIYKRELGEYCILRKCKTIFSHFDVLRLASILNFNIRLR